MILQHWKHHQEGFSLPSLCRAGPDLARKRDMCRDNIQPALLLLLREDKTPCFVLLRVSKRVTNRSDWRE